MQPFKLKNTRTHTCLLHSNIANLCTPWGLYCLQLCHFPPTGVGYTYAMASRVLPNNLHPATEPACHTQGCCRSA